MWKKLQNIYKQNSETTIHIVQQRFFQSKHERGIEMSVFLTKIQEIQHQLKEMGEDISDNLVITKSLMSLPDEYKHFVSAWESTPHSKQTIDNLVARLIVKDQRIKKKSKASQLSSSATFIVKNKQNIKCFKFNRLGHFQNKCIKS